MRLKAAIAIAAVALAAVLAFQLPASSGDTLEEEPDEIWYVYGDDATFECRYEVPSGGSVEWQVYDSGWNVIMEGTGQSITMDLSAYGTDSPVYVRQTVTGTSGVTDTILIEVLPLHIKTISSTGSITVLFYDVSTLYSAQSITGATTVKYGEDHVFIPSDPEKTDYEFGGWYWTDSEGTEHLFDASEPVTAEMVDDEGILRLDAKWIGSGGGGGGSHTVVIGNHSVVFEAVNGLRCDTVSTTSSSVTFKISVIDGYAFYMDDITVTATYGSVTLNSDGTYTLSGIYRDTVVSVSGDRIYSVEYRLSNSSVSVPGYDSTPGKTAGGGFSATVSSSFGWAMLSVTVYMDGIDVTSDVVSGGSIEIDEVTGNLVIIADSSLPWLVILVIVVVIAAAVAYYLYRRRS
ncbi:MAG: hypothetical protein Q4Q62_02635 [Thermoplasmata archaeon]|nr:hypothetical protein [Thermoplasmata archaeon]